MAFKRQNNTKYNHFYIEDESMFLLGFDKNVTEDDITFPISMYDDEIYTKAMQLELRDRNILISSIETWEKEQENKKMETKKNEELKENSFAFVGIYWDIITDFILQIYGCNLYDFATILSPFVEGYEKGEIYDTLDKMRRNKGRIGSGKEYASKICALSKISESILETGRGTLYVFDDDNEKYNIEEINNYYNQHKQIDIKKMIADISGVKLGDIREIPLQIVVDKRKINQNVYQFIDILINKMIESRD